MLGASIYDVRTEGGRGSRNTPNLRTDSADFADKEGMGVKKSQNLVDVINGSPLTDARATHLSSEAWQE